jgi:hypothetical protein
MIEDQPGRGYGHIGGRHRRRILRARRQVRERPRRIVRKGDERAAPTAGVFGRAIAFDEITDAIEHIAGRFERFGGEIIESDE